MNSVHFLTVIKKKKKKKRKPYFNNLLHIHQHTSLKYMIHDTVIKSEKRCERRLSSVFVSS